MHAAAPSPSRADRLDALRGAAIVWMVGFHFCFDLNYFGWLQQDFYRDPFWTTQRTAIVSLFLFCAGSGQALAVAAGQGAGRFWRRWGRVAGCALLVSAGSWWMFPRGWISFGILHGMAAMLLALRLGLARWPTWALLALAALALVAPQLGGHPFFDSRWTNWVGLVTHKPVTEDYAPVLPWLGVMLLGFVFTRSRPALWSGRLAPGAQGLALLAPLALLGRWPLSIYMLHQPLLLGLLAALHGLN